MKKIKLTQNKYALVDDEDFDRLNQYRWQAELNGHVWYAKRRDNKNNKNIKMHRVIMKTPDGVKTDHMDRNGLNNQKSNLRICTDSENAWNRKKRIDNISGFKGVSYHRKTNKWQARIMINGTDFYLGLFTTKLKAYEKYCKVSVKYHGKYSRTK